MRWERVVAVLVIALGCVAATEVAPSQAELAAFYQKAEKELGAGHYASALKELDAIDARQPGLAAVQNFRGVVLMRQGKYLRAETALQKALAINPHLWSARFNLADIPFLRKNWTEAGSRFAALREAVPRELADAIVPLVDYKILLTVLFENEDEKVGAILSKLKGAEKSPAFDYAEAAIAFHRGKRDEGKDWMTAAEKDFPADANQLFRESFYEVGWLPRPTGEPPILAKFAPSGGTAADAPANLEQAKRAFEVRDFQNALKFLDAAQQGVPGEPAAIRLRARILLGQGKFDEAEAALNQAAGADQTAWETKYIRAKISLGRKDYADAGVRLKTLLNGKSGILKPETAQLIRYQLFLALLQEGNESAAQQTMDQFKFTDQTPALYYAQAAWNFQHDNPKQARQWVDSAKKLFSEEANSEFASTLLDLGSLGKDTSGSVAASSPSQSVLPSPAKSPPPQVAATKQSKATPEPTRIASAHEASPAPPSTPKTVAKSKGKKQKHAHTEKKPPRVTKARARRAASAAAAPTRAATSVPIPTPAPTPRPPFLNRLARSLLHTFERQSPKTGENNSNPPAGTEPAKPTTTPARGRKPEN
ncbi:MAG: tetratricopeptide repeat protein [Chthoniobacterales bacterium]